MDLLSTARENFLNPIVLFFFLGLLASLVKSDLAIPRDVSKTLSLYLLIAIGFKGGAELVQSGITSQFLLTALVAVGFSLLLPVLAFALLKSLVNPVDAAAIGAHYGSVSVVTFVTATAFLGTLGVAYEPFMVALMAIMESPAIVAGIFLAHRYTQPAAGRALEPVPSAQSLGIVAPMMRTPSFGRTLDSSLLREAFLNGSIVLITGSLLIGFLTGESGMHAVRPFLIDPFQGVLALFLLDMGIMSGRRMGEFRQLGVRLTVFALVMPLIGGVGGAVAGALVGLSLGGTTLLAVLAASASYIAVPAAMRIALPQANPSLYLTMSLAITFPFNVVVGIPIYYTLAGWTTALF